MQNLSQLIRVELYEKSAKNLWDTFVVEAKNSHFFFKRDYMDYHSDRFKDHSLLFFDDKNKLLAVLPANSSEGCLYSHQGLSFGGLILSYKTTSRNVLDIFVCLKDYMKENGFVKLIYKAIPHIYHDSPAEEDLYALQVNKAKLFRRDLSSTIKLSKRVKFQERRSRAIQKAKKMNLEVKQSDDYEDFWAILSNNLEMKYAKKPVHSLLEITSLAKNFPNNIKLFTVEKDSGILAGAVIYENSSVIHTQYLVNSEEGQALGALDLVIDFLISDYYKDSSLYFDLGISTENNGLELNHGLVEQKQGFGARAIVHDFYELEL